MKSNKKLREWEVLLKFKLENFQTKKKKKKKKKKKMKFIIKAFYNNNNKKKKRRVRRNLKKFGINVFKKIVKIT